MARLIQEEKGIIQRDIIITQKYFVSLIIHSMLQNISLWIINIQLLEKYS